MIEHDPFMLNPADQLASMKQREYDVLVSRVRRRDVAGSVQDAIWRTLGLRGYYFPDRSSARSVVY